MKDMQIIDEALKLVAKMVKDDNNEGRTGIYIANINKQMNDIDLGHVIRRYGTGIKLEHNRITLAAPGFYDIETNVGFTGSGTVSLTIYFDDQELPGATAKQTIIHEGDFYHLFIPAMIHKLSEEKSYIEIMVAGDIIIHTITTKVERIADA